MGNGTHVRRVVGVLAILLIVGFTAQRALQPDTFGDLGHYRAASIGEMMVREPVHQGRSVCGTCHAEQHALNRKDVHWRVECEVCHGPGRDHVDYHSGQQGRAALAGRTGAEVMPTTYTLDGCLLCHRKLRARPVDFAQVDPLEHYAFLKVTDPATPCIECHAPHEPLFLQEPVHEARIHPVIFECRDCHESAPDADHRAVPEHPTIFVCADCHPSVAHDFTKHEHAFLRCTACHLFDRENEISGRVYLNGGSRFCLLCHERKPFKDSAVPQIDPADHLLEQAPLMRRDPADLAADPAACLQCHFNQIHDAGLIRRLQEQER